MASVLNFEIDHGILDMGKCLKEETGSRKAI